MKEIPSSFKFKLFGLELSGTGKLGIFAALFLALLTLLFLLPVIAKAEEFPLSKDYTGNYLCKMTAGAGIRFDQMSNKWVPALFDVTDKTYVMKVTGAGEGADFFGVRDTVYNITVKDFGSDMSASTCFVAGKTSLQDQRKIPIRSGVAGCMSLRTVFQFNFETLKIQSTYDGGYMDPKPNNDTPHIAVGECQRID